MRTQGHTLQRIAEALAVCVRTVQRWLTGAPLAARPLDRSHRRKLGAEQSEAMAAFFRERNTSTLADGARFLRERFGLGVSGVTIWRTLRRLGLSFQKGSTHFREASRARQQAFLSTLPDHLSDDWIALDEAAFFLNHARAYAWGPRGKRAVVSRPGQRKAHHSLLLAISPAGVIDWHLFPGGVDSVRFQAFLAQLPERSHLLLDNASTHHARHVLAKQGLPTVPETAKEREIAMQYLLPYSPTFNPVEYCFNAIRTHVNASGPRTLERLQACVGAAVGMLSPAICRRMFVHALGR